MSRVNGDMIAFGIDVCPHCFDLGAIRAPLDPTAFVAQLKQRLHTALTGLSRAIGEDTAGGVRIAQRRGQIWITVPRPGAQDEPTNLQALKDEVQRRYGLMREAMARDGLDALIVSGN